MTHIEPNLMQVSHYQQDNQKGYITYTLSVSVREGYQVR